eukprot:Phypoly_transcript_11540.p1 GENE.Phypoly_transcript_11540~~Phypoly_transcript_11540.p1  ORF type:complete len:312 (+),score=40.87 Phypoly_transcript_11540:251-1186(+)
MPTETQSSPHASPLVPSKDRSYNATLKYGFAIPSTPPGEKWSVDINNINNINYARSPVDTTVYDLRGQESKTHIDVTGFQAITSPSSISSDILLSGNDKEIEKIYYPEVEALLLKSTGASRVVFFDHTVRMPRVGEDGVSLPTERKPVLFAHVDQTPVSAHKRVARHVNPPVPFKRFQLINVWRPIKNTVYDYPLAVCEAFSVDVERDLEPTDLVYPPPTPTGETYSLRYNKNQVWWYWSEMTPDEVLLLKCYDSASLELSKVTRSAAPVLQEELRDVAGLTPHTGFFDSEGAKKGIPRLSIEVRALVFYD